MKDYLATVGFIRPLLEAAQEFWWLRDDWTIKKYHQTIADRDRNAEAGTETMKRLYQIALNERPLISLKPTVKGHYSKITFGFKPGIKLQAELDALPPNIRFFRQHTGFCIEHLIMPTPTMPSQWETVTIRNTLSRIANLPDDHLVYFEADLARILDLTESPIDFTQL